MLLVILPLVVTVCVASELLERPTPGEGRTHEVALAPGRLDGSATADTADGFLTGSPGLLADYAAEIRRPDGRLDVERMVERLAGLAVDTYFYLIWHRETDWEDLKRFLPAARAAGIDVWAYLVPPSESPPRMSRYSEPFRLDYLRWAEEIARLSLTEPNLKAFVIDDFHVNDLYTPEYVRRMRERARAINPRMRFLPLMYFPEIDREWVEAYGDAIDGVVAAYPPDPAAIRATWSLLNDAVSLPARYLISFPWKTRSASGSAGSLVRDATVLPGRVPQIRLTQRDDYAGPTAGYHFKQLRVDGRVVWEEDVAGGKRDWQEATVRLPGLAAGPVQLEFRVFDRKGVGNFGVDVELRETTFEGLESPGDWRWSGDAPWRFRRQPAVEARRSFRIPLVVMVAGNRSQFTKRNGAPPTPERIRSKVEMALGEMQHGFAEGVVTYSLRKDPGDPVYRAVRQLFVEARRPPAAGPEPGEGGVRR